MKLFPWQQTAVCHVVAIPYPGRGHINPMMNLCTQLVSTTGNIRITFVVTEEWLGFLRSETDQVVVLDTKRIHLASIPNVVPSEKGRAANMMGFIESVTTKMEAPFEVLLDELEIEAEAPVKLIMADTFLFWAVGVGNRRNIPVASFWPLSATIFSIFQHFDLLLQNRHYPVHSLELGEERVDYIPGVSSTRLKDFPGSISGNNPFMVQIFSTMISWVAKAQYLLFTSFYELEPITIDALRAKLSLPIYTVGPAIPCFNLSHNDNESNCIEWLRSQPESSVLYVSFGSFLSVSGSQVDEIEAGLRTSGVRFLWVVRAGEWQTSKLKDVCGEMGLVVPWCDQLRVLSHPCIGGFLTHCGWNSVREGIFAGVPFLNFPVGLDQTTNSKLIEEDWKIGWRVRKDVRVENLVTRDTIAGLVRKFMDMESTEVKQMRRRAKELKEMCQHAVAETGSSEINIKSFIKDISEYSLPISTGTPPNEDKSEQTT